MQEVEASIETLRNYIDWTPFFMTGRWRVNIRVSRKMKWWVKRRNACLKTPTICWINSAPKKTLNPRGVVGLFPANRVGDDVEIYRDETRTHVLTVSHHLRQQTEKVGFANYRLADFVAPKLSGKSGLYRGFRGNRRAGRRRAGGSL